MRVLYESTEDTEAQRHRAEVFGALRHSGLIRMKAPF